MAAISTRADGDEKHEGREGKLRGYSITKPWTGGTLNDALVQSAILSTITMSYYSFPATKDSATYAGAIVGRSPFDRGKTTTTISVKLIPLIVTIGSSKFDPTATDACAPGALHTTVERVQNSPLFVSTSLSLNGVSEGSTQYMDAFRRAEFDSLVGSYPSYHTMLSLTTLNAYTLTSGVVGTHGATLSSGCTLLGTLSNSWLDGVIKGTILPSYGAQLGPTDFVIVLLRNVVQSTNDPPTFAAGKCCILGYHGATGVPVQTYGTMEYDSTGDFGAGTKDISVGVHEVGEWLDDPLGTNPTPAWGGIGQVGGCQGNLEVGDPLSGTLAPGIIMPFDPLYTYTLRSWHFSRGSSTRNSLFRWGPAASFPATGSSGGHLRRALPAARSERQGDGD